MPVKQGNSREPSPDILLRDSSRGPETAHELGRFRSMGVGIVTKTNEKSGELEDLRTGKLLPRNWHELEASTTYEGDPPWFKDRRYDVALIADRQNTFGGFHLPTDEWNPWGNDWSGDQRSTRVIDMKDSRGRSALLIQGWRVMDDAQGTYTLAIPMGRLTTSDANDHLSAGYILDETHGDFLGLMDLVFTTNPSDKHFSGREGTPIGVLGLRHDAHFEWNQHGAIYFDETDLAPYSEPTCGKIFKTTMRIDTAAANVTTDMIPTESGEWRPWFQLPILIPGGGTPYDGNVTVPGDPGWPIDGGGGGGTPDPGMIVLPGFTWTNGDPPLDPADGNGDPIPGGAGYFCGMALALGLDGTGSLHISNADGTFTRVATEDDIGGGGSGLTTGTNAARPGTPSAVGDTYVVTDKLNGPTTPSGSLDPTNAMMVGLLDGLTWGAVGFINGWPQTVSSNWTFSGSPRVSGDLTKSGSGTIDANKLVAKSVTSSPSSGKALSYNGTSWVTSTLGLNAGGTNSTAGNFLTDFGIVYVNGGQLMGGLGPDAKGGQCVVYDVSSNGPIYSWDLPGGECSGSNQTGADRMMYGMRGTGTGIGGNLLFKTSPAGSSGSSLNALVSRVSIRHNGDVVLNHSGSALATNASGGFTFIPNMAGTPSGTPTTYTGSSAMIYDTSADKLWIHVGGGTWKSVALT